MQLDENGTVGAVLGFAFGMVYYDWALRRAGTPYYVKFLEAVKTPRVHVVAAGDSWQAIGERFETSVHDLVELNSQSEDGRLVVGQTIRVAKTVEYSEYVPSASLS